MSLSYMEEEGCNYVIAMTFQDQEVQIQAKEQLYGQSNNGHNGHVRFSTKLSRSGIKVASSNSPSNISLACEVSDNNQVE